MSRHALRDALFACVLLASGASYAGGTVSGRVTTTDNRNNPYVEVGCGANPTGARQGGKFAGQTYNMSEILVRVQVVNRSDGYVWQTFYTKANASGDYSVNWTFNQSDLHEVKVAVFSRLPVLAAGTSTTSMPAFEFSIGNAILDTKNSQLAFGNVVRVLNFAITPSDVTAAYLTALEVFQQWANAGDIRPLPQGISVNVNDTTNFTPLATGVGLTAGTATAEPYTLAHELGHALMWQSWEMPQAIIFPTDYFMEYPNGNSCGNYSWSRFSCEHEKVAFAEGWGDLNGGLWMWNRAAAPAGCTVRIPRENPSVGLEGAGSCFPEGTYDHNKPICNARALWDIVDNPVNDDDSIQDRGLTSLVNTLKNYPTMLFCWAGNRTKYEGYYAATIPACGWSDVDGNNWRDFRASFTELFGVSLNQIEDANGLDGTSDF